MYPQLPIGKEPLRIIPEVQVIEEAEEIQMTACDDFDSVTYLLYSPSYPWQLKGDERDLTEEQLVQLFGRYVRILTDVPIDVDSYSM